MHRNDSFYSEMKANRDLLALSNKTALRVCGSAGARTHFLTTNDDGSNYGARTTLPTHTLKTGCSLRSQNEPFNVGCEVRVERYRESNDCCDNKE
jgi:hypothetical protein